MRSSFLLMLSIDNKLISCYRISKEVHCPHSEKGQVFLLGLLSTISDMKPHLPLLLRAAVLACIVASFSGAVAAEADSTPPDYTRPWVAPAEETDNQTINLTSAGLYDATANAPDLDSTTGVLKSTLTDSRTTPSNVDVVFAANSGSNSGDFYGELRGVSVTFFAAHGYTSRSGGSTMTGNAYAKLSGENGVTVSSLVCGAFNGNVAAQQGVAGSGNVYVELDNQNGMYTGNTDGASIVGADNASVAGSVTIVIKRGTVAKAVVGGCAYTPNSGHHTIGGGTFLQMEGGTFNGAIVGGSKAASTIDNGSHIYIKGGSFNSYIVGGSESATRINDGSQVYIGGGTFRHNVFAGNNNNASAVIKGDAELCIKGGSFAAGKWVSAGGTSGTIDGTARLIISGGTFGNGIIAAGGTGGTVKDTELIITGGTFDLTGESTHNIYAGGNGATITGGTKTILKNIGKDNDFTKYTHSLYGGNLGEAGSIGDKKVLELQKYTADKVYATLGNFDTITVTDSSSTRISNSNNSTLGDATALSVEGNSTLELAEENSTAWNLGNTKATVNADSTLTISGAGQLTLKSLSVESGSVKLKQASAGLKIGYTTFTAKEVGTEEAGTVIISGSSQVSAKGGIASGTETEQAKLSNANISIETLADLEVTTQDVAFIRHARFENVSMQFGLDTGMTLSHVTFDAQSSAHFAGGNAAPSGTVTAADTTLELVADDFSDASPTLLAEADGGSSGLTSTKVVNLDLSRFDALTFTDTLTLNDQDGYIKGIFDADPGIEEVVLNYGDADLSGVTGITYRSGALPSGIQAGIVDNALVFKAGENMPEPSTATLSLLALAAIAARRRRKAE